MEMARCLLHRKDLSKQFWADVVKILVCLLKLLPTKALNRKNPFEAWYGTKLSVEHVKVFGCVCYTLILYTKRDKLDKKKNLIKESSWDIAATSKPIEFIA